jgi:AMIN domain
MCRLSRLSRSKAVRLAIAFACSCLSTLPLLAQVSVRSVKVLGGKDTVEVEVEAGDRIIPQTQVLTGPDRLVVDFPNAVPGSQVRSQSVDRGEVRAVRVGLFQSKPPITRLVLDLKSARSYQIFPSGRTVMIKVMESTGSDASAEPAARPGYVPAAYTTRQTIPEPPPQRPLEVTYRNGSLSIVANKATLSEVLYSVQQRTGADIAIPAGAEQEKVVAELGPAPAPEVLARLLNGSNFNFLILSAVNDPNRVDRVVLTPRVEGGQMPLPPMQETAQAPDEDVPPPVVEQANDAAGPGPAPIPEQQQQPQQNAPPAPQPVEDPN